MKTHPREEPSVARGRRPLQVFLADFKTRVGPSPFSPAFPKRALLQLEASVKPLGSLHWRCRANPAYPFPAEQDSHRARPGERIKPARPIQPFSPLEFRPAVLETTPREIGLEGSTKGAKDVAHDPDGGGGGRFHRPGSRGSATQARGHDYRHSRRR